ncbi:MAG TPA: MG2 domain-containing protein [Pyrinomonadaceae bacterium]
MSRRWLLSLLCFSVAVVFAQLTRANDGLRVNESATRFLIQDHATVVLEVVNPLGQNLPVHLKLELLDTKDLMRAAAIRDVALQPGTNSLTIPLTLSAETLNEDDDRTLPWYRLSYQIDPSPEAVHAPSSATGIISLSQIDTPDIFAIEMSTARVTHLGGRQYTHVRASHPITGKPVKDVNVSVELKLDDDEDAPGGRLRGTGVTDAAGYAVIGVNIPANLTTDECELKVVARHGGYVKETSHDVDLTDSAQIMVTTDKPIYQPGQSLHVRALVFNSAHHAAANAQATLKITDPENTNVFQTSVRTSRFGVATADWVIPENTRLGNYGIQIELDDENYGESQGYETVKISRYDLPNFSVKVKPDRTYYQPRQNADVVVRADYIFGQPVKRGHVRVIREESREWNFREQKWDIKAGEEYEGETAADGQFVAHIDLKKAHQELAAEEYSRFNDLHYAAYFTDPTTNRTEQRRFDLRVTKDAIHIYVVEGRFAPAKGLPMQFYVATSYADGTPASCDVTIRESQHSSDERVRSAPILKTIRTNKYGIAKVAGIKPPGPDVDDDDQYRSLDFTARHGSGFSGHHTQSFYYRYVPVIRVETDKALYRPGEGIKVNITASEPEMDMIVDVSHESNIIESRYLSVHNGAATFTLNYGPEFQDEVSISAYSKSPDYYSYNFPFGSCTVMFPRDRDLKLNFRLDHADYKPGEDATVDFRVFAPDGRPADSALGVVIFDRAVEERARTDQDFGGTFGFYGSFSQWRGYDNQIGGITRKDLQRIDLTRPLPEGMELVAELLLGAEPFEPRLFSAEGFDESHARVFAELTGRHIKPIVDLLETRYKESGMRPEDGKTLRRLLFESGVDFDQIRDPWGEPYHDVFSIDRDNSIFEIVSSGPDKIFATKDDFSVTRITRPYFRFTGEAINRAVEAFHVRTGGFIRDAATLKTELESEGINFDSLRDPWGQPYDLSFAIKQNSFHIYVQSSGPNKTSKSDDFIIWISSIDYLRETRARIEKALADYFKQTDTLPQEDRDLQRVLVSEGVDQEKLHDPWGHRYYANFKTEFRFADRAILQSVSTYNQQAQGHAKITPVTQQISSIYLRSAGEDGKEGTADDFEVAKFSRLTVEQTSRDHTTVQPIFFAGAKGAIKGTVIDPSDAVVAGAKVKATLKNSSMEFEAETNEAGGFILRNLPVGFYELRCDAAGFKSAIIKEVPVSSSNITTVDFRLEPGAISEVVTVTAEGESRLNTTSSQVSTTVTEGKTRISIGQALQLATPRLREYFPETLVWQPSLETDKQGRAQLKFKLADNITTWKMSVIGSTEDGEMGTAETEIKAFQPFFVEHDPPRVLTEGDQISLPIVLRNYLERSQTVDLEIKPENWFTLKGPARQRANVPAGDAVRQTFDLQAVASVKDGKQRVTASGPEASDSIEKPVTVHPDGEEKTQTASDVFGDAGTLTMNLPPSVIPGSTRAELKIYPSLMGHVVESVEGILERPHGCGEQTISSTYPSLLVLRRNKHIPSDSRLNAKAQRYAQLGYQRLLNYRTEDGGFSYWGRGEADLALTAYALRFLHDAKEFIPVDDEVIKGAREWLFKRQLVDGSWPDSHSYAQEPENQRRTALLTAFVARVLAMTESSVARDDSAATKQEVSHSVSMELKRALSYLSTRIEAIDEPYLIASYALAATEAGDKEGATRAAAKLRTLAHNEGDTSYWALETNTPFYGWGLAGRVETSALAIQALARTAKAQSQTASPNAPSSDPLVRSGLLFLLRQKDRYGVWYSTQATINVLDTLMTLLATDAAALDEKKATTAASVQIIINGQLATSMDLPPGDQLSGLLRADISRFLQTGANRVELRRPAGSALASVQLVANYYVPWSVSTATQTTGTKIGESSSLRLATTFEKKAGKINDEIACHVKAERVGFYGYGMILAEIGLPPGADVDRASLESAMTKSGWAISQYDVLPDRVVVYLWPRAGGVDFDFKFRPRFALTAKTAPSVVYDYYNPEARAVVVPVTFDIK